MPRYKSKKYGLIYMICDYCGKYACFSDGKKCYCGNCVNVIHTPKGVKFERK